MKRIILLSILLAAKSLLGQPVNKQDSLVLVDIYNSCDGKNWYHNTNWLTGNVTEWSGVSIEDGRVVELSLYRNNLTGEIPAEIGKLTSLKRLYLYENALTGKIPEEISSPTSLIEINLKQNKLTGEIPNLRSLNNLEYLDISNNLFTFLDIAASELTDQENEYHYEGEDEYYDRRGNKVSNYGKKIEFNYSPQGKLAVLTISETAGDVLVMPEGHPENEYRWFRDYQECIDGYGRELEIKEAGKFYCEITNYLYPKLTLKTEILIIPPTNRQDSLALVAIYNSCGGDDSYLGRPDFKGNWLKGSVFDWREVEVKDGRVVRLKLKSCNLEGKIPSEIGNLTSLIELDLSSNDLTGKIPAEIGNLTNLIKLTFVGNELTGKIPAEIGNLTKLEELSLRSNKLTEIPREIGNLVKLKELNLCFNELTSAIPSEIGNLVELEYIDLDGNKLTGIIPPEIGKLQNLEYLILNDNKLTGEIPKEIGNLTNLKMIRFEENSLTGKIPPEIENIDSLKYLYFYDNKLTGEIPPELGNLPILEHLNLGGNKLTGEIPPELSKLQKLTWLSLPGNNLTGEIPKEICKLKNLEKLYLSTNSLTGTIPPEIGKLVNLTVLDMGNNSLTGEIPEEICNLKSLYRLCLSKNNLSGNIPSQINSLTELRKIILNENNLTGKVPNLSKSSLSRVDLRRNFFTFDDLAASGLKYHPFAPQKKLASTLIKKGDSYILTIPEGHPQNKYKWFKYDWFRYFSQEIDEENNRQITIPISDTETYSYYCEVTNDLYPKLTLITETLEEEEFSFTEYIMDLFNTK